MRVACVHACTRAQQRPLRVCMLLLLLLMLMRLAAGLRCCAAHGGVLRASGLTASAAPRCCVLGCARLLRGANCWRVQARMAWHAHLGVCHPRVCGLWNSSSRTG